MLETRHEYFSFQFRTVIRFWKTKKNRNKNKEEQKQQAHGVP